jgi:hypothetical protein
MSLPWVHGKGWESVDLGDGQIWPSPELDLRARSRFKDLIVPYWNSRSIFWGDTQVCGVSLDGDRCESKTNSEPEDW